MPLNIPTKDLGPWCAELTNACYTSLQGRRQRGAAFRNLYLTGAEDGSPQTYRKTYSYIQTLAAMLYSPLDLHFAVSPSGPAGPRTRAMGRAAATNLGDYMRSGNVDTVIEDAVEWGLVKGKTFVQLEWTRNGLQPTMVQPESMGVYREDITSLDKQDAFVHSTWMTPARFADLVANHPKRTQMMRDVIAQAKPAGDVQPAEQNNTARQVIIGGQLYPYRAQGSPGAGQGKGLVNWLSGPTPELDAQTVAELIRLDELWVWDRMHDDWVTFQLVGNTVVDGDVQFRNIFAEGDPNTKSRWVDSNERNPLSGHHPFVQICPNPLPDYFWGWSELMNVAALQLAINNRVNGINRLLRLQEDPPWLIHGPNIGSRVDQIRSKLRRPGGWHIENSPGLKVDKMAPDLPQGLWESLHEWVAIFDAMGGFMPVVQGKGEEGVRAQSHAETLVRMASGRFKDRALGTERQVAEVGGLSLDLVRAKTTEILPYWVKESEVGPFKGKQLDPELWEPPAPGMVALGFQMAQLTDQYKVTVDSHSSSPLFSDDARKLVMALAQRGAITTEGLIRALRPPSEEERLAEVETAQAEKAASIAALPPEARAKALTGKSPSRSRH